MTSAKRTVLAALFTALCVVFPYAFHMIPDAGSILLPMHLPVLVCGMVCGWPYGFLCGLVGPLLSCLLTAMPPVAYLPPMMVECAVYGLVSGLVLKYVHTGKLRLDLYIALVTAMVAGRVVSGVAKALIFSPGITLKYWLTANFITALPGIAAQLVLIPLIVSLLMKLRYIPNRYAKEHVI